MLLAINIGNTNIQLGLFKGNRLLKTARISIKEKGLARKIERVIAKTSLKDAVIVSVVPKATRKIEEYLLKLLGKSPYIIGKNLKVPMRNLYRVPRSLGQDRLVNAYAASVLYGAPVIVISLGTAITLDTVSRQKEYLGGMILPGLNAALDALFRQTAQLPRIKLQAPKEFIGRDTRSSILSGVVLGSAALCNELARKLKKILGKNALVIATGGDAELIAKYSSRIKKIDPELTLKGLRLIYRVVVSRGNHFRKRFLNSPQKPCKAKIL